MEVHPFGPRNEEEALVFVEENFRVDVQHKIHKLMVVQGIPDKDLAERLGVTEEDVEGFFGDDAMIDLRMLARIFRVLGFRCELKLEQIQN
jgi:DNA-binding Xre family transcriptional regulator